MKLIGNTPIVKLTRLTRPNWANVYVKLEYLNPTGSHKDRIAYYMIKRAEEEGKLKPNGVVVEASSGNTAISVAWLARIKGYKAYIVVTERTSPVKVSLLKALGAEVVVAPHVPPDHPKHYRKVAEELARKVNGVFLNQYANEANVQAHYETTAVEIWRQMKGKINAFVMGVGTGGTLTGVGRFLKERLKDVKVVAVVPKGSALSKSGGELEYIEGLIEESKPILYNPKVVDDIIEVSASEAKEYMLKLLSEGILAGPSTGANIYASLKVSEELGSGKNVVTIAADSIFRYVYML